MIGGGEGAFIGAVHRMAARLDGRYQLVAGVFSSDAEKTKRSATALGVDPARAYPTVEAMIAGEKSRADGIEVVSIVTPNVILGGLLGAIIWNLITWYYGLPSSSSHALVGGYAGAAVAKAGWAAMRRVTRSESAATCRSASVLR